MHNKDAPEWLSKNFFLWGLSQTRAFLSQKTVPAFLTKSVEQHRHLSVFPWLTLKIDPDSQLHCRPTVGNEFIETIGEQTITCAAKCIAKHFQWLLLFAMTTTLSFSIQTFGWDANVQPNKGKFFFVILNIVATSCLVCSSWVQLKAEINNQKGCLRFAGCNCFVLTHEAKPKWEQEKLNLRTEWSLMWDRSYMGVYPQVEKWARPTNHENQVFESRSPVQDENLDFRSGVVRTCLPHPRKGLGSA